MLKQIINSFYLVLGHIPLQQTLRVYTANNYASYTSLGGTIAAAKEKTKRYHSIGSRFS
jgi:hypothetical protein